MKRRATLCRHDRERPAGRPVGVQQRRLWQFHAFAYSRCRRRPGFDFDGNLYQRINLTNLRSIPLGDRWGGEISIDKNTITVVTVRANSTDDSGVPRTRTIEAKRP